MSINLFNIRTEATLPNIRASFSEISQSKGTVSKIITLMKAVILFPINLIKDAAYHVARPLKKVSDPSFNDRVVVALNIAKKNVKEATKKTKEFISSNKFTIAKISFAALALGGAYAGYKYYSISEKPTRWWPYALGASALVGLGYYKYFSKPKYSYIKPKNFSSTDNGDHLSSSFLPPPPPPRRRRYPSAGRNFNPTTFQSPSRLRPDGPPPSRLRREPIGSEVFSFSDSDNEDELTMASNSSVYLSRQAPPPTRQAPPPARASRPVGSAVFSVSDSDSEEELTNSEEELTIGSNSNVDLSRQAPPPTRNAPVPTRAPRLFSMFGNNQRPEPKKKPFISASIVSENPFNLLTDQPN